MTIKTNTRCVEITLLLWNGEYNQYSPDCFGDMETNFPADHQADETGAILATDAELDALIAWWTDAVAAANSGEDSDSFYGLDEDAIERGDEWALCVEVA